MTSSDKPTIYLEDNDKFLQFSFEEQIMTRKMVDVFTLSSQFLYMSPEELTEHTNIGNPHRWARFLSLEPVDIYVQKQLAEEIKIGSRRGIGKMIEKAAAGDSQMIRETNTVAGLFEKRDSNKIVVLHQISRPQQSKEVSVQ